MTQEERNRIFSEDYADLIIDYRNNPHVLEGFQDATIHIMNDFYAVVHIPVSQISNRNLGTLGFTSIPSLLGLCSQESLEASGVDKIRNIPSFNLRGKGVLVGIIDTGIQYTSPVFKNADGTTKIYSIWDQTIESEAGYPFNTFFGTEYKADQINQALQAANPLDVVPSTDDNGHGTMLAAISAGMENESAGFYSVAPDAELVVVKLTKAKKYLRDFYGIPDEVLCYQENSVMWGVQYCIQAARRANRPVAICIGIGSSQDPHDGSAPLSALLSIFAHFPKTGIVTAIGNEGNRGRHYHGVIDPGTGYNTVELNVGENDKAFSMELWGDSPGIFSIDILSPSGEYIPRIAASLRVSREISFIFDETIINIEYQTVESRTGDQLILFRFRNTSAGIWRFNVYGSGGLSVGFHIWLPMDDMISTTTYFVQSDIYTTLLTPSTSEIPMTVTAYNPITGTLFVNAGRGYSRSGAIKPELAAPGVNYIAPNLNGAFTNFTGTGVAAAHATGIAALVLEWGVVRGNEPNMDTLEIKKFLIRGGKRSQNLSYPNRDWGYGTIDLFNSFDILRSSDGGS